MNKSTIKKRNKYAKKLKLISTIKTIYLSQNYLKVKNNTQILKNKEKKVSILLLVFRSEIIIMILTITKAILIKILLKVITCQINIMNR